MGGQEGKGKFPGTLYIPEDLILIKEIEETTLAALKLNTTESPLLQREGTPSLLLQRRVSQEKNTLGHFLPQGGNSFTARGKVLES